MNTDGETCQGGPPSTVCVWRASCFWSSTAVLQAHAPKQFQLLGFRLHGTGKTTEKCLIRSDASWITPPSPLHIHRKPLCPNPVTGQIVGSSPGTSRFHWLGIAGGWAGLAQADYKTLTTILRSSVSGRNSAKLWDYCHFPVCSHFLLHYYIPISPKRDWFQTGPEEREC